MSLPQTSAGVDWSDPVMSSALFEDSFEHAPVGMAVTRPLGGGRSEVLRCNPAYAQMLGFEPEQLVGRDSTDLMHPDDAHVRDRMLVDLQAGRPATGELRVRHREGHDVWILLAPSLVTMPSGEPMFVMHAVDISERKRFERQLQYVADHDPLTGLLSRRRLEQELAREAARLKRSGGQGRLLLIDLDGFKDVNDTLGHSAGDALLRRLGDALRDGLREVDVLARIGGDEFAVILPDCTAVTAGAAAERLLEIVRTHGRVAVSGRHVDVTASIGITVVGGGPAGDAESLLVEADIAMYQAKEAGRDQAAVFAPAEGRRQALARRADWVGRLRAAVAEDRLVAVAQPIVALQGRADRERYELLLRLRDEDGALVPPGVFLHHAERQGMIGELDRWMLAHAVDALHRAHREGRPMSLAVNASALTLQDLRLAGDLADLLADAPIGENRLVIEVTETSAITHVGRARELARQLRRLGCKLALDDFGTGFASFAALKSLDFDLLKIDGSFIDNLLVSRTDQLLVRAVVDIARGLGAGVVAERVGDQATLDLLTELGVDFGQGYFLGRPAPL